MQTHCSGPKGFRRTKLNAKSYKFSTKKPVERSNVFLFYVVVQGLKVIKIPKIVRFKIQA